MEKSIKFADGKVILTDENQPAIKKVYDSEYYKRLSLKNLDFDDDEITAVKDLKPLIEESKHDTIPSPPPFIWETPLRIPEPQPLRGANYDLAWYDISAPGFTHWYDTAFDKNDNTLKPGCKPIWQIDATPNHIAYDGYNGKDLMTFNVFPTTNTIIDGASNLFNGLSGMLTGLFDWKLND